MIESLYLSKIVSHHRVMIYTRIVNMTTLVVVVSVLTFGCTDSNAKQGVSGTVSYRSKPITNGTITFLTEETNSVVCGTSITDGKFEIPAGAGLAPGKYKVMISQSDMKGSAPKEDAAPGEPQQVKELLPKKYNRDTELQADIKAGEPNELTYDLK